jgi:hypothetical protein
VRIVRLDGQLGYGTAWYSNINAEEGPDMKGKRLRRCTLQLPAEVVRKLKSVAKHRSRREMKRVPVSVVVLDAVLAAYFPPRRRQPQGGK